MADNRPTIKINEGLHHKLSIMKAEKRFKSFEGLVQYLYDQEKKRSKKKE